MKTLSELSMKASDDGVIMKIRAVPGASRERIVGLLGDALKVAVTAAPEKGCANKRIIQVLAKTLEIAASSILLVSGMGSRDKKVLIRHFDIEELRQRLAAKMPG